LWSVAVTGVLGADQFLEHVEVRAFAASAEHAPEGAAEAATAQTSCYEGWGPCFLPSVLAIAWRGSEGERREGERKEEREER
jgi:hypothetical protein